MNMGDIFSYGFITNSLLAALFTSIVAGIVGTYIVSRRMVFLAGGITHASFGGVGLAYFIGMNPILGAAVFAVITSLGIDTLSRHTVIRHDSLIGLWWSAGMALGIFFIYLTPGYSPNLMTYLFGSILTVNVFDVWALFILSIIVVVFFGFFHKPLMYMAFDPEYARSHRVPTGFLSMLVFTLIALSIVFSIKVAGIILVLSLLTIPQAISNLFTKNYKNIMVLSVVFSLVGILTGLILSFLIDVPSGASIIGSFIVMFIFAKSIQIFLKYNKTKS